MQRSKGSLGCVLYLEACTPAIDKALCLFNMVSGHGKSKQPS